MDIEKIKEGVVDLVSQDEFKEKLNSGRKLRIKFGVDPTRPDLHLGHAVPLHKLRQFQDMGHHVFLIIGDFTAQVGDPSGRDSTRPVLDRSTVLANANTYIEQAYKILDPDQEKITVEYNSKWLGPFTQMTHDAMSDLIKVAKSVTVSRLLEREDFKNRMKTESPISLLEMLYPIFQGYDSVAVKADVEIGGQDQIFNLLMGRDIQKLYNQPPQVVMTMPLLVGTDGVRKMSKSYDNYISFTDTAADIFGKTMSISDETMFSYYKYLIDDGVSILESFQHPMEAKKELGKLLVEKFYGKEEALKARQYFEQVFSRNEIPSEMPEFTVKVPMKISQIMVASGIARSANDARRLIEGGAVRIDSQKISGDSVFGPRDAILQVGKRNFRRLIKEAS